MTLRKNLEKIILFNGKPLSEVKNSRIRRAMLNTIDSIVLDTLLVQDVLSLDDAVYNIVTDGPDSKYFVYESRNLNDYAKNKIEKIFQEQLRALVRDG